LAWLISLAVAAGGISGCAHLETRQRVSPLPIATDSSGFGSLRASAWESKDHLYVSGSVRKHLGIHHPPNLRVRVDLLDEDGSVILSEEDRIPPTSPRRSASGRRAISFVVKFPLTETDKVTSVQVKVQRGDD
jgi:hypothetical protein